MTNIDTADITPAWKLGAIGITKELVDTCSLNLIELARYMVVQDHEQNIEAAIALAAESGTDNVLFGGDATTAATLTTGDTTTVDLIADAIAKLKDANSFKAKALFIANEQEKVFHKSSQFTNAAEYGSDKIVLTGEIGDYLGLKILSTENTTAYAQSAVDVTDSTAWGAAGHSCLMVGDFADRKVWMTLAWKQKLTVDYEYLKRFANHYIYYDAAYAAGLIQPKAQCLIKVTDA
jgi:N4-gp56 family major capsid protein